MVLLKAQKAFTLLKPYDRWVSICLGSGVGRDECSHGEY